MQNKIVEYKDRIAILEKENRMLSDLVDFYKSQSLTDALTQIGNRRLFDIDSKKYMEIADRNNLKLFLILIDIDDFKKINDTKGHDFGDEILKNVSSVIKQNIRGEDECYRIGGDEFAIFALDTSAKSLSEELCERIKKQSKVCLSMGVVECSTMTIESAKKKADSLLYASKQNGKNCTSCLDDNNNLIII